MFIGKMEVTISIGAIGNHADETPDQSTPEGRRLFDPDVYNRSMYAYPRTRNGQ